MTSGFFHMSRYRAISSHVKAPPLSRLMKAAASSMLGFGFM